MTAKNTTVSVPKGEWTRLTDAAGAAAEITCVLLDDVEIWLNATADTDPPAEVSAEDGDRLPVLLATGNGWNNIDLATLFPGVSSGAHLWAFSPYGPARVFISHA